MSSGYIGGDFVYNIDDEFTKDKWTCLPGGKSVNKKAIFFSISDSYSFAAANMIMGLNQHSPKLMQFTDIIIYHNGISETNMRLLKSLHNNTYFVYMSFPESWHLIMEHPRTTQWGAFVISKLYGFFLRQYRINATIRIIQQVPSKNCG